MSRRTLSQEEGSRKRKSGARKSSTPALKGAGSAQPLARLQQQVGNRAVQRLLAQRSAGGLGEVDDETAGQINQKRGGGQALDSGMQAQMSASTGTDFSQVRVHTDGEADDLSQRLGARAFTTGQDVFFKEGAYQPHTAGGQELLAHELTHVVQQRQGHGTGLTKMQVNQPGDTYEREADQVAHSVTAAQAGGVQMQEEPEEEEQVQSQEEEEEAVQTQAEPEEELAQAQEEEEEVQMQAQPEEEELAQAQAEEDEVQMQELKEEEEKHA